MRRVRPAQPTHGNLRRARNLWTLRRAWWQAARRGASLDELALSPSRVSAPRGAWNVGSVVFHPPSETERLAAQVDPDRGSFVTAQQLRQAAEGGCLAEVAATETVDMAVESIQGAIDALRLFVFQKALVRPTWFGLNGGNRRSRLPYLAVDADGQIGLGGRARGDPPGFHLSADSHDAWSTSSAFQFLSRALRDPGGSEGNRRSVIGTSLVARAADEQLPSIRMLYTVAAVDAWLGTQGKSPQTNRLARAVSWLTCGVEYSLRCGRESPPCAFIFIAPGHNQRLESAELIGEHDPSLRCPTWSNFRRWYDLRSSVAHGKSLDVPNEEARRALHWVTHRLAAPVLDWLAVHEVDPVESLDAEIEQAVSAHDWMTAIAEIDRLAGELRQQAT